MRTRELRRGIVGDTRIVLVVAVLLLLVITPGSVAARPEKASEIVGDLRITGRWITDGEGRAWTGHGLNIAKKIAPGYPPLFSDADSRLMASSGFNLARVGFIWEFAEPAPGRYDDAYLDRILAVVDSLRRHGIHTLLDLHQDFWSRDTAFAGDGAPRWATLGPSYREHFENFWRDAPGPGGVGIATRLVRMWEHVMDRVTTTGRERSLVGIDPLNEPQPGVTSGCDIPFNPCRVAETTKIAPFYQRFIATMRARGVATPIWPEGIANSLQAMPAFKTFGDDQVGINAHYYCAASQILPDPGGVLTRPACAAPDRTAFDSLARFRDRLDTAVIMSEWGGGSATGSYGDQTLALDRRFISWTEWMYYDYGTEPLNLPGQGFLARDDQRGTTRAALPAKAAALVVPYARAVAGTPQYTSYDRASRRYSLIYLPQPVPGARLTVGAQTEIAVPRAVFGHDYRVTVRGGRVTSRPGAPVLTVIADSGSTTVSVTVTPPPSR